MWYSVVFLLFVIGVGVELAHADIGINISSKCKIMLKNNLTTTCPTLDEILLLFADTSPRHQIGDFETIDGITQRGSPQYSIENINTYFRALGPDKRTWIDPPSGITDLKMITIESNFEDYPLPISYKMENNTIIRGTERYVNSGCTKALINSGNWIFLLGDTIRYMQSECTITNFDHIKKTYYKPSYQDFTTTYKYTLEQWVKQAKADCLTICKNY